MEMCINCDCDHSGDHSEVGSCKCGCDLYQAVDYTINGVLSRLCYSLDMDMYIPVREELKGCGRTYSLGVKKEAFKGKLEAELEQMKEERKQLAEEFQFLVDSSVSCNCKIEDWGTDLKQHESECDMVKFDKLIQKIKR